ncbi:MAG: amino acid ABC transporter permease [Rhodobacteraceae bacterium]|nr:amino acid ABC transporter permease [Paracoccaceae bacterium]
MALSSSDLLMMLQGLGLTALLTFIGTLLALALAVPLALSLRSGRVWLVAPARLYVEVMRGAPLVLLLFLLYYGGPQFGLRLSAPVAGIVGLGLFGAGAFAEILRAGLDAVHKGDVEAARMLGMSQMQSFQYIEIPQAARTVIPPIFGQSIILVKESAVLSVITIAELTKGASELATITFSVQPFIVAALLYWALVELVAQIGFAVERRYHIGCH